MGHDLLIGWVNYKTKFLAIDDQLADVWVGMVVYVLCVQWTVCFSLAGLSFLWLEGGQFLWAVLVWTRKCGWYSFRNLWPIGMDVLALRQQRPTCC